MNILLIITILIITALLIWLFTGAKEENKSEKDLTDDKTPEKIFRRRAADKEIEEETPEYKRKTDKTPSDEEFDKEKPFKLPYLADEIIPKTSRFKVYRRTLLNSEVYAGKGHFSTAISLYEGVAARINDAVTKNKIIENINYLKNYMKHKDNFKARSNRAAAPADAVTSGDLRFALDGHTQRRINIEVFNNNTEIAIDKITEKIKRDLKDEFEQLNKLPQKEDIIDLSNDSSIIKNEIDNLKNILSELNEEKEKISGEINKLKEKEEEIKQDFLEKIKEEKETPREEELILKKQEQLDLITDQKQNLSEINRLNRELSNLKEKIDFFDESIKETEKYERKEDVYAEDENDSAIDEISGLKEQVEKFDKKLEQIAKKETAKKPEPLPIVFDPQPLIELFKNISEIKRESKPEEKNEIPLPAEKAAPDAPGVKDEIKKSAEDLENKLKLPSTEKVEDRTLREKYEEDENEFDLLSDLVKEKDENGLSDEEIFEKILKDDKSSRDDENDFEILGDKREDDSEYDIFDKEREKKRKEDENFYRNFVKTNRKKKKELPILKVNFDFSKLPDAANLSKEKNILEYSFYKYKPMLEKAGELIRKRRVREAIDYYKVVLSQNIPPEFKVMIKKNINDLTEYLEKYLTAD